MSKNNNKNVVFTGGKTGGHIYPALAILEILKYNFNINPFYIGLKNGLEERILSEKNIVFYGLKTYPLKGVTFCILIKNIVLNIKSFIFSFFILLKINPKIIIGTGGFVSGPVLLAAYCIGIPIILHEQNVFPGSTNKILSILAKEIWVTFNESKKFFPIKSKVKTTGMPLRESFNRYISKKEAKKKLGFNNNDKIILIIGGSQGSKIINEVVKNNYKFIIKTLKYKVIHIVGDFLFEKFKNDLSFENKVFIKKKYLTVIKYMDDIFFGLRASNLAITRSGANFISELVATDLFSIQIPLKNSAGNHQFKNAKILEKNGYAKIIEEKNFNKNNLKKTLISLIKSNNSNKKIKNKKFLFYGQKTSKIICKKIKKYLGD